MDRARGKAGKIWESDAAEENAPSAAQGSRGDEIQVSHEGWEGGRAPKHG